MSRRVVITGMGVIAPNGHGLEIYEQALRNGESGIRLIPYLAEYNFACQVAGVPQNWQELGNQYFSEELRMSMNSSICMASIAAVDAWKDAGLEITPEDAEPDWDSGAFVGTGIGGLDTAGETLMPLTNEGRVRRLGSTMIERVMSSGVSARVGGILGLGNQVTTNSSACSTGTEAIIEAFDRIQKGAAKRVLAGGVEGDSMYGWAGFDAMRVLSRNFNETPEKASRPMSATACGFVPGSGAGLLVLEDLDTALARGARIYAEIIGGNINSGGHRMGGSMTAPNPTGVQRCVQAALKAAGITGNDVDSINGHLTATFADPKEVKNWSHALGRDAANFPKINATKSLIGHALGGAGGLEGIACVLQVYRGFMHGSLNCEDLHPDIEPFANSVVRETCEMPELNILAKASFGFGDVNSCVLFKKWKAE